MTTEDPQHIPVDVQQVTCPMCNEVLFEGIVPHTPDGPREPSDALRAQGVALILEHEKTCKGNT